MNGAGKSGEICFGVGLVVSLMAVLGACGADSDVLSSAELATEMNQICVDNGQAFEEIGHPETFEEIAAMTPQLIEVFDATLAKHAQRIDAILIQDDLLGGLRQLEPGAPPRFANGKLLDVAGNVVTNRASLTARWISSLTDRPTRFDTTRSDFQSSPVQ